MSDTYDDDGLSSGNEGSAQSFTSERSRPRSFIKGRGRQSSVSALDEDKPAAFRTHSQKFGLKKNLLAARKQTAKPIKKIHSIGVKAAGGPKSLLPETQIGDGAILSGPLKIRDVFKNWHMRFCVLQPGSLHYYKQGRGKRENVWLGSIMLSGCKVSLRSSKKEGFCFKIYHPTGRTIYAMKRVQDSLPVGDDLMMLRAEDATMGQIWMKAIKEICDGAVNVDIEELQSSLNDFMFEVADGDSSEGNTSDSEEDEIIQTTYHPGQKRPMFVQKLNSTEGDELNETQKKEIWACLRQLSPGSDMSDIYLPSFVYERRSLLERLSYAYSHVDLLSQAAQNPDPLQRILDVTRWYISFFYQREGIKMPIAPVLGEIYRCAWTHEDLTRTYFVAEQVSSSPPTTAWYVTNRKHGFFVNGNFSSTGIFSGNAISADVMGQVNLRLLRFNEDYLLTFPQITCKGVLHGAHIMEYHGPVTINCEKTGYGVDLDFKLKPPLGGSYNGVTGRLKGKDNNSFQIHGMWDRQIEIINNVTHDKQVLWSADEKDRGKPLPRLTVLEDELTMIDSERIWSDVYAKIQSKDFDGCTAEMKKVYEAKAEEIKNEPEMGEEENEPYSPRLFNLLDSNFIYRCINFRPWEDEYDEYQYEYQGVIYTQTRDGPVAGDDGDDAPLHEESGRDLALMESAKSVNFEGGLEKPKAGIKASLNSVAASPTNASAVLGGGHERLNREMRELREQLTALRNDIDTLQSSQLSNLTFMFLFIVIMQAFVLPNLLG